jgi:TonB family protein
MLRDIVISCVGHLVVIGSVVFASSFVERPTLNNLDVYRVKTVSPESISELLQKQASVDRPRRTVPQVKTEKPQLPTQHRKKSQTVKRSKPAQSTTVGKTKKSNEIPGIKTDIEFDFPEYLLELRDLIEQKWKVPFVRESLATRVFFRIGRDGTITRVYVEAPTGNITFDSSALQAVIECDPFPRLPEAFENDQLGVHFDFIYENN